MPNPEGWEIVILQGFCISGTVQVDDSFLVIAFTGNTVYTSLDTAPKIKIGNAEIENAVFLIFNDSDLSVPSLDLIFELHNFAECEGKSY